MDMCRVIPLAGKVQNRRIRRDTKINGCQDWGQEDGKRLINVWD